MLVLTSQVGPILTVTLNRPERRNAFTVEMLELLASTLTDIADSVRVVILEGAVGDFSTGFDLIEGRDLETALRHSELLVQIQLLITESERVFIAVVGGFALAGGGGMVAACDYAVATHDSQFGYPVLKVGIVPTPGIPFLKHELGDRKLRELVLGGELKSGTWAAEHGLVNYSFATLEEAQAEALRFAGLVVQGSPNAVRQTKAFTNRVSREEIRKELEEALAIFHEVRRGPEAQEGLNAFAEKRPPNWQ
jgi:methylglutaconyl-CoA hydratase